MTAQIVLATLDARGQLSGVGRAHRVARATVQDGAVIDWRETEVKWDETHDRDGEGDHHASIARFLQSEQASELVAAGAGPGMQRMLERMGLRLILASGTARGTVEALARLHRPAPGPAA